MAAFCGGSPLTIPSVAMCRFKFRHWKWLRLAERGKTAGLNKAIINKSGYSDMLWVLLKHYCFTTNTILTSAEN